MSPAQTATDPLDDLREELDEVEWLGRPAPAPLTSPLRDAGDLELALQGAFAGAAHYLFGRS